jgi:glycerophosphoryl diester phosphodiesterase
MRTTLNITAHAGNDGTPDDSLESVEAGIRLGADAVEVDIRLDRRGAPALSHNFEEGREYRGRPRLEEAMRLAAGSSRTGINCDVKEGEALGPILETAERTGIGPDRLILTGAVSPGALAENPGILEKAAPWLNIEEAVSCLYRGGHGVLKPYRGIIEREREKSGGDFLAALAPHFPALIGGFVEACLGWGVRVINMPDLPCLGALIPLLAERGIGASVWTVDREEDLRRLFGLGVMGVTTRKVRLAAEVRAAGPSFFP